MSNTSLGETVSWEKENYPRDKFTHDSIIKSIKLAYMTIPR